MNHMIKKAILPVAGLGTRFLPASKSIPKEMVTVVDRPAIEYVVKEAVAAGIEQIILVTHSSKASIENYFDRNFELETTLENKNKFELDVEYVDTYSIFLDFKIMFKTVEVMLKKEGINAPDQEVGAVRFSSQNDSQSESIRK